ncbi:DUF6365 family protein [Streptacidiphilus sp. P02-A3a]|uniref:DUF6365 family protein n=1 Tax=Streptacidiphilus sp. P02-A3a TaxID=2704468 RepID=UPI0015FC7F38|nr:DUF6365 family protein [Streptacidiphilus sp. P02-A3a]QMU73251.1 hypothetical protein GXP74_38495 [Streptacidiphilus sp. P02-A3a]
MKLLFFALSTAGYGETVIGTSLADQLRPLGVQSHFVISEISAPVLKRSGIPHTVLDPRMRGLARLLLDELVAEFRPDAIVLADYFTFTGVFQNRYGLEPWFIEEYQLPILPIDIWEWEKTDFAIDIFDEPHEVDRRLLEMETHLRPVPLAHPEQTGRAYPFRLWEGGEQVSRRTRGHLFTTFGLNPQDRLVMLPVAAWQQLPEERYASSIGTQAVSGVPRLLAHYLRQLPETTHFLLVGQAPPELAELPAERTHVMPPCSPARFSTLLGSADLVLSLNIGATTLARAILSDIPGVALTNSFAVPDAAAVPQVEARLGGLTDTVRDWLGGIQPLHRMRMWPLGFHDFLEPLLTDNPYADAVTQLELLDEPAVVRGIEQALYDSDTRDRSAAARADYLKILDAEVDTRAAFAQAASRLGLAL